MVTQAQNWLISCGRMENDNCPKSMCKSCDLSLQEKFSEQENLNKWLDFVSKCRHVNKYLLSQLSPECNDKKKKNVYMGILFSSINIYACLCSVLTRVIVTAHIYKIVVKNESDQF